MEAGDREGSERLETHKTEPHEKDIWKAAMCVAS